MLSSVACGSRRVIATRMKRVAATNSHGSATRSRNDTVLIHRLNVVVAAGRLKSALPANDRTQSPLVDPHQANRHICRQKPQPVPHIFHVDAVVLLTTNNTDATNGNGTKKMDAWQPTFIFQHRERFFNHFVVPEVSAGCISPIEPTTADSRPACWRRLAGGSRSNPVPWASRAGSSERPRGVSVSTGCGGRHRRASWKRSARSACTAVGSHRRRSTNADHCRGIAERRCVRSQLRVVNVEWPENASRLRRWGGRGAVRSRSLGGLVREAFRLEIPQFVSPIGCG